MRVAFVLSRLPCRRELAPGPVDAEWIASRAGDLDPLVFTDHESAGTEVARSAGIEVHVSDKRQLGQPSGGQVTAEEAQARLLLQAHDEKPLDALIYGTDRPLPLDVVAPGLSEVPRGVAVGLGSVADQRWIVDQPELAAERGYELWSTTGFIASADFLVSDVAPAAYGYRENGDLPSRYALRPDLAVEDRVAEKAGLVVVVAATGLSSLGGLLEEVECRLVGREPETILVVHRPLHGEVSAATAVRSGTSPSLRRRTVLVCPGGDGAAASFLAAADQLVCVGAADLAVPAVAEQARVVPTVILDRSGLGGAPGLLDAAPQPRWADQRPPLVTMGEEEAPPLDQLDDVMEEAHVPGVVLHAPDHERLAHEVAGMRGAVSTGLTFVAEPLAPYGQADPQNLCPHVLGVGSDLLPSLRQQLSRGSTLQGMIAAGLDLSMMDSYVVNFLPHPADCDRHELDRPPAAPPWCGMGSPLPRPRLPGGGYRRGWNEAGRDRAGGEGLRDWATSTTWTERIRLALPWRLGLAELVAREGELPCDVRDWAKDHRWVERARVALPWRWGLLPRAMEGRW